MHRRLALTLSVFAFGVLAGGCAEVGNEEEARLPPDEEVARLPPNNKALDRKVLVLESGMPIEVVQSRLGKPIGGNVGSESQVEMLFYGRWELSFLDGRLDQRLKYVVERPLPDDSEIDQVEQALDRRVLGLRLGTSIEAIEAMLGIPDTYTIYKNAPGKEEALSYETWDLTFVDGALTHRQK